MYLYRGVPDGSGRLAIRCSDTHHERHRRATAPHHAHSRTTRAVDLRLCPKRSRRALRVSLARFSLAFSQRSPLLRRRNRAKARAPCPEESTRHLAPLRHRWHVDEHRRWLVAVCRQGGVRVSFDLWSPLGFISGVRHHGLGLNCRARLCEACSMTSALMCTVGVVANRAFTFSCADDASRCPEISVAGRRPEK